MYSMSSSLSAAEIPTRTQTPRPIEEISSESTGKDSMVETTFKSRKTVPDTDARVTL